MLPLLFLENVFDVCVFMLLVLLPLLLMLPAVAALLIIQIAERGPGYLETEIKRLKGLLGGSVSPSKKTLFMVRSNILNAFVEAGVGREVPAAASTGATMTDKETEL